MLTAQEIFNTVATHLLTQRRKSVVAGSCKYRTDEGLKCAVGCLITDEEYDPRMEGNSIDFLIYGDLDDPPVAPSLSRFMEHSQLLRDLQRIHDADDCDYWEENLRALAAVSKLDFIPPGESDA